LPKWEAHQPNNRVFWSAAENPSTIRTAVGKSAEAQIISYNVLVLGFV
jgi:hypothetical protein